MSILELFWKWELTVAPAVPAQDARVPIMPEVVRGPTTLQDWRASLPIAFDPVVLASVEAGRLFTGQAGRPPPPLLPIAIPGAAHYGDAVSDTTEETRFLLNVPLEPQPTDTSCGPTCLQAVYNYFGDRVPLATLIKEVPLIEGGGTLAVLLGVHALQRGYRATLYTYNLKIFDPSWFDPERLDLEDKLRQQIKHRSGKRRQVTQACLDFVEQGGEVRFEDLTGALIRRYLLKGLPILTGLSATFLYRSQREMPDTNKDDDIRGESTGHFVVLKGYHKQSQTVLVADPWEANPLAKDRVYEVSMERLINAILLGVLTYDANLLIVRPKKTVHAPHPHRRQ